jgi:hypothetical protein
MIEIDMYVRQLYLLSTRVSCGYFVRNSQFPDAILTESKPGLKPDSLHAY